MKDKFFLMKYPNFGQTCQFLVHEWKIGLMSSVMKSIGKMLMLMFEYIMLKNSHLLYSRRFSPVSKVGKSSNYKRWLFFNILSVYYFDILVVYYKIDS